MQTNKLFSFFFKSTLYHLEQRLHLQLKSISNIDTLISFFLYLTSIQCSSNLLTIFWINQLSSL